MSITKWKTENGYAEIERVECTRETKLSVWFMQVPFRIGRSPLPAVEKKLPKRTERVKFFDAWEAAHESLMEDANFKVQTARRSLERAHDFLGNVKGLKKPNEAAQ